MVFHLRISGGNREHQPLPLYQFDIDVHWHLPESLQHDKLLSSLISTLLWQIVLWQILSDTFNNSTNLI